MRWKEKPIAPPKAKRHFAWLPVYLPGRKEYAWLESVWLRRTTLDGEGYSYYGLTEEECEPEYVARRMVDEWLAKSQQ